ncbi:MAG: hypothetical protein ACLP7P_16920 [Rhodomicrobium sp.]
MLKTVSTTLMMTPLTRLRPNHIGRFRQEAADMKEQRERKCHGDIRGRPAALVLTYVRRIDPSEYRLRDRRPISMPLSASLLRCRIPHLFQARLGLGRK